MVYLASYNSMGYENYQLFERLAQQGITTIAIPSNGRYPGDMTMANADMVQQLQDAQEAIRYLHKNTIYDFNHAAIVGYSWGGMAGALLSASLPGVKCIVSLEGSEYHHYGSDKKEDGQFNGITLTKAFSSLKIGVPYLRLESTVNTGKPNGEVYDFSRKLISTKRIIKIKGATHQDFCALPEVAYKAGGCKSQGVYAKVTAYTQRFLLNHVGRTLDQSQN